MCRVSTQEGEQFTHSWISRQPQGFSSKPPSFLLPFTSVYLIVFCLLLPPSLPGTGASPGYAELMAQVQLVPLSPVLPCTSSTSFSLTLPL